MNSSNEYVIVTLSTKEAERWFEVGPRPASPAAAQAQLNVWLRPPSDRRPFRLLATDAAGHGQGKIGGYVTESGRLTFWAARHAEEANAESRAALTRLLVNACIAYAKQEPSVNFVETQPAFDTPELDLFLREISAAGLRESGRTRAYAREIVEPLPAVPGPWSFADCAARPSADLDRLFARVQSRSFPREASLAFFTPREELDELRADAGSAVASPLWFLLLMGAAPVGYALCQLNAPAGEGILVELGVEPAWRRRGIGTALVIEAMRRLRQAGAARILAFIDDRNQASIALHSRLGFRFDSGPYMTWRRAVRSS